MIRPSFLGPGHVGPRRAVVAEESGSAVIEFIVIAVLVLIPMCYVVLTVMRVQAATYASTQAVREAGRAFSMADSVGGGVRAARIAADLAFADQGFEGLSSNLRISCTPGECLSPGSNVQVRLDWQVPLPWLPSSFAVDRSIPISAVHEAPVDVYRASP